MSNLSGPRGGFNSSTTPIAGVSRPSSGGGSRQNFTVADNSNSALRRVQATGINPRTPTDAPFRQLGNPQTAPSSKRARLMTGAGSSKEESVANYNTGMGGMSSAAFRAVERFAPSVPAAGSFQMAGSTGMRFGAHQGGEYGAYAFAGLPQAASQRGVQMFRQGPPDPRSRTAGGLVMSGMPARPTELDTNPSIHGMPNPDPRNAPGSIGGPNGPPLAASVTASTRSADPLTEEKPYEEVNATLQHAYIIVPLSPAFVPEDHYGQFMVVLRSAESLNANTSKRTFAGPRSALRGDAWFRYTATTVTGFNFLMANNEIAPVNLADEMTALDAWKNWEMMGCCKNETNLEVEPDHRTGNADGVLRLFNLVQSGPVRCFNMFGRKAMNSNVKLYFIFKRVRRAELARLAQGRPFQAEAKRILGNTIKKGSGASVQNVGEDTLYYKLGDGKDYLTVYSRNSRGQTLHPSPFQLVPYATDSAMGVPLKERQYVEMDGSIGTGVVIEVGCTFDPIVPGYPEDGMAGMVDASRLTHAGQLDIQMHIMTQHC